MATSNSTRNWFAMSTFLFGIVLGGFGGVARGDWLGKDAAKEVEIRVNADIAELKEDLKEIKQDLKELLRIRD